MNYKIVLIVIFFALGLLPSPLYAQSACGIVDQVDFPVHPDGFSITQGFAVASPRHQGRFHTGEDWYGGRGSSLGQPVRAAANGRVVYAFELGWGRDGGVVILEHTFPGGDIVYTQYGHMQDTELYPFPTRLACVKQGDIIGSVGDARPAPHLHFEVRSANGINGTDPGAGYSREDPFDLDYRNPSKFIHNQQTWLHFAYEFHVMIGTEHIADERGPLSDPLILRDNSLLYLNGSGNTLRRALADGRILWRTRLDTAAVAITGWQGNSLLTLSDGTMQLVDVETGGLGDTWQVDAALTGRPIVAGERLIFPANDTLIAIAPNRQDVLWRIENIPTYRYAAALPNGDIALLTRDDQFIYLDADGNEIERTQLREMGHFAAAPDGTLLAYTKGGLWRVDRTGTWSLYIEALPGGGNQGALLTTSNRLYAFDGETLYAFNNNKQALWQTHIPLMSGVVEMAQHDDLLLMTSNGGNIAVVTDEGHFCNQVRVWGNDEANQWHDVGDDGILRVAIADQIVGLNWGTFTRPCRV